MEKPQSKRQKTHHRILVPIRDTNFRNKKMLKIPTNRLPFQLVFHKQEKQSDNIIKNCV